MRCDSCAQSSRNRATADFPTCCFRAGCGAFRRKSVTVSVATSKTRAPSSTTRGDVAERHHRCAVSCAAFAAWRPDARRDCGAAAEQRGDGRLPAARALRRRAAQGAAPAALPRGAGRRARLARLERAEQDQAQDGARPDRQLARGRDAGAGAAGARLARRRGGGRRRALRRQGPRAVGQRPHQRLRLPRRRGAGRPHGVRLSRLCHRQPAAPRRLPLAAQGAAAASQRARARSSSAAPAVPTFYTPRPARAPCRWKQRSSP